MTNNPIKDIETMMLHYGFKPSQLTQERLKFRFDLLQEEVNELMQARIDKNAPEVVDALIDICVIALGTLHLAGCDVNHAWAEVQKANMAKLKGTKPGRPSDGWDLYKPLNWKSPNHDTNVGNLPTLL
jgi:predicted HAD superfamily Cof-like phosphohydrolase